jgi:hypothetical protein
MTKSDFMKHIRETIISELGDMSIQAKQSRKLAIQAEIRNLQIELKDKQLQLSQLR